MSPQTLITLALAAIAWGIALSWGFVRTVRQDNAKLATLSQQNTNFTNEITGLKTENLNLRNQLDAKPKEVIKMVPAPVPDEPLRVRFWNFPGMRPLQNAEAATSTTWVCIVANKKLEAPVSLLITFNGQIAVPRNPGVPFSSALMSGRMTETVALPSGNSGDQFILRINTPSMDANVPVLMPLETRSQVMVTNVAVVPQEHF